MNLQPRMHYKPVNSSVYSTLDILRGFVAEYRLNSIYLCANSTLTKKAKLSFRILKNIIQEGDVEATKLKVGWALGLTYLVF